MTQFHETPMGRKFFEGTLPALVQQLKALAGRAKDDKPREWFLIVVFHDETFNPELFGPYTETKVEEVADALQRDDEEKRIRQLVMTTCGQTREIIEVDDA